MIIVSIRSNPIFIFRSISTFSNVIRQAADKSNVEISLRLAQVWDVYASSRLLTL